MIGQEETSEVFVLEKVFSQVLVFRPCKYIDPLGYFVFARL